MNPPMQARVEEHLEESEDRTRSREANWTWLEIHLVELLQRHQGFQDLKVILKVLHLRFFNELIRRSRLQM